MKTRIAVVWLVFGVAVALSAVGPEASAANTTLLGSPQVRRELVIPHAQAVEIVALLNKAAYLNQGGLAIPSQVSEELRRTNPAALHQKALSFLTTAQKQRLQQIEWQMAGPHLFEDWNFAHRIGVTPSQSRQLRVVFDREFKLYVRGIDQLMESRKSWYGKLDYKRYAWKYTEYDRQFLQVCNRRGMACQAVVERVLTPDQKAKWKTLLGKPFDFRHLTYDIKSYPMD